ncbi:hypothetical protein Cni_G08527 [Canna indica]|uniref:FAS1 domain-containing protein n=1 Tax=Canna indica TaxID=4628 RepID=A0AAQ3K667_9LILI|nr:hypothetical protein Cni_G08527 [Canna indica]
MRRFLPLLAAASLLLVLMAATAPVAHGYNITKILAQHPEFSTFNHYLSITHLANDINRRLTITVLAVDNAGMADVLSRHYSLLTIRNVLALHVLTDYYGAKKLHQLTKGSTLASSIFQSSGHAPGTTGYINISDHRAGKVSFITEDAGGASPVSFVKSIKEMPYNLSILQVNRIMSSPEAEAPVAAPPPVNLTELMAKKGCKAFADLLLAEADVLKTFEDNLDGGLTVFCPIDSAVKAFAAKYKNLTAEGKSSLLLYHGVPIYFSPQLLKSNAGVLTTLASTDGPKKNYHFSVKTDGLDITVKTHIITATVQSTVIDQDPDAIYAVNKVLEPRELFKVDLADAPAPAGSKKAHKGASSSDAAAGPDEAPSDQEASDSSAFRLAAAGRCLAASIAGLAAAVVLAV